MIFLNLRSRLFAEWPLARSRYDAVQALERVVLAGHSGRTLILRTLVHCVLSRPKVNGRTRVQLKSRVQGVRIGLGYVSAFHLESYSSSLEAFTK